ncbi:NAD-dependent epimerase/dehydratase family protein [Gammaproteobacteria bacterium]|nr:NAD-dependent epimerase/dehydratase family protein [Gammaproteobacteria bacterium]
MISDKNDQLRVMVTGANGFVGKVLTDCLINKDIQVVPCIRKLGPETNFGDSAVCECGDINKATNWQEALSGVDTVVHTAARVHVMSDKSSNPLDEFRRVNVDATLNLARQASKAGVKRFIYLSSVKVNGESSAYGNSLKSSDSINPVGPYAISKLEAEQQLFKLSWDTGLEIVIIRPPLIYGPGVKANFAMLASAVRRGLPLPLGKITQNVRSMVSLDNLVDFISVCLQHPAAANEVFMVSDGEDVSTADLVLRMAKVYKRNIWLIPVPISALDKAAYLVSKQDVLARLVGSLQVDIQKNFDLLNWKPKMNLDDGLSVALASRVMSRITQGSKL